MQPDPREARLPAWARQLIAGLRADLREERTVNDVLAGRVDDPRIHVRRGFRANPIPVASFDCRVDFDFDPGWVQMSIQKDRDGRTFIDVLGIHQLAVLPESTNHFRLELA